jgi:protein TonB
MGDEEIKTIEEKQAETPRAAGLPCAWARIWENPGPKPMPVGGAVKAPKKLHDVAPVVPYRKTPPTGSPILEAIIATDGTVAEATVVRSFDPPWPEGDEALVEAIKQWKYKPTLMDGKPIPVCTKIMLNVEWTELSRD